ncbi:MAG: HEAT repeat domain-containing protein [Myxococcales bacterium]|nr:HEAT repeat domain-containing protein [Myxococcales bacterium]
MRPRASGLLPLAERRFGACIGVVLALGLGSAPAAAQRFGNDVPVWRHRPRVLDIHHLAVDIAVDIDRNSLSGTATTRGALLTDARELTLDAAEMTIRSATVNGQPVAFQHGGDQLVLPLPTGLVVGDAVTAEVRYEATPNLGFYFVHADAAYPDRPEQAWTQGEPEESRFWYPASDYPDDRLTSETTVTVDADLDVLSNGVRGQDEVKDGRRTVRYRLDQRHVNYLVSVVVGRFETVHLGEVFGVALDVYAPPGRRDDVQRAFRKTPDMLRYLSELTAMPLPYGRYGQVLVEDFMWAGMENATLSTLTVSALPGPRSHPDEDSDGLIVHELAHQWFGNWVSCRSWQHLWLNEGFATYLESMWFEHDRGKDYADFDRVRARDWYFSESYRRRLDEARFEHPDDLFDGHTYGKGAWVLHMLRRTIGDAAFTRGVRRYLRDNADDVVETDDLRRAFEEASGLPLDEFFGQWVSRPGHPRVDIRTHWSGTELRVEATQSARPPYALRLPVTATGSFGERSTVLVLEGESAAVTMALSAPPSFVEVDRDADVLVDLHHDKHQEELLAQLERSRSAVSRASAAEAIGDSDEAADPHVVTRLGEVARNPNEHREVREAAVESIGRFEFALADPPLLELLASDHSRIREAAAESLSGSENPAVLERLLVVARRDPVADVAAAALDSALDHPKADVEALLREFLDPKTHEALMVVAVGALDDLGGPKGYALADQALQWGRPTAVRARAAETMARIATVERSLIGATRKRVEALLGDPRHAVRLAAITALGTLGDPAALPVLEGLRPRVASQRDVVLVLDRAIRTLRDKRKPAR